MKEIRIETHITAPVLFDYLMRHTYSGLMGVIGTAAGALLLIAAYMQRSPLYALGGIIVIFYIPVSHFFTAKKQVKTNPSFKNALVYTLKEDGIYVESGDKDGFLPWEGVVRAVSTGTSLIIYSSRVSAWIFPKKDLGERITDVIEMLSTHIRPGVNHIKG